MKRITLLLIALAIPLSAYACQAYYTGEAMSGMNKICYYNHLGSTVAYNVRSHQLCPMSIQVSH